MKKRLPHRPTDKSPPDRDFRIDFATTAAFIGPPQTRHTTTMSQDIQDSSTPLAEISQGPSRFEQFLDRNQKNLVVLGVLIALAAAGWVVYDGIRSGKRDSAGAALNQADDLAKLQEVIKSHSGTPAEGSAHVLLAERQWNEGQQDAAIETLRSFVESQPSHPAVPNALASLAAKKMIQGKSDEAKSLFEDLIDRENAVYLAPFALISLGDIALAAGDENAAKGYYEKARTEHPSSPFANTASQRAPMVEAKMPTEIDPPPASESDTTPAAAGGGQPPFTITPVPDAPADPEPAPEGDSNVPSAGGENAAPDEAGSAEGDGTEPATAESPETDPGSSPEETDPANEEQ